MKVTAGSVIVDGAEYKWSVFRQPRWTNTGGYTLLGLAILVEVANANNRELLLEFGIDREKHGDMPQHQRFRIPEKLLVQCVRNAIEAGWDPNSRGKRFVFDAGFPKLD